MKITVRLRDDLAKAGMGFSDIEAKQEIRHKPGGTVEVEQTPFVQKRIETGEVIVVSTSEEESDDTKAAGSGNANGRGGRGR